MRKDPVRRYVRGQCCIFAIEHEQHHTDHQKHHKLNKDHQSACKQRVGCLLRALAAKIALNHVLIGSVSRCRQECAPDYTCPECIAARGVDREVKDLKLACRRSNRDHLVEATGYSIEKYYS